MKKRVQFILKNRLGYTVEKQKAGYTSSGLYNSARFVRDMLEKDGYVTELAYAEDNNSIDRLVSSFDPDVVVIEAYWVVPEKFEVLHKLHPDVTWVVRNHSAIPFLASEGVAIDWSLRYTDHSNVVVSCNDPRTNREFRILTAMRHRDWSVDEIHSKVVYLPNYYPPEFHERKPVCNGDELHVACMGAVRSLKNHLQQAIAALEFAEIIRKKLIFHINSARVEGGGEPVLKNLRGLFNDIGGHHKLKEHSWLSHAKFVRLLRKMDAAMQVSQSETFSISSADAVMNDVPIVASTEVRWIDPAFAADPTNSAQIVQKLGFALWAHDKLPFRGSSVRRLREQDEASKDRWQRFLNN